MNEDYPFILFIYSDHLYLLSVINFLSQLGVGKISGTNVTFSFAIAIPSTRTASGCFSGTTATKKILEALKLVASS